MTGPSPHGPREPQDKEDQSVDRRTTGRSPAGWRDIAEEAIEEAMRAGAFDNLPGSGKPLTLINNPFAAGTELAYQLLKDNQYTLPWISERVGLLASIQGLRDEIALSWRRYQDDYCAESDDNRRLRLAEEWSHLTATWEERISRLNRDIATLNLKQPGAQLEIMTLSLGSELDRAVANQSPE
jgi:DnaJ family protein C protein 28